MNVDVVVVGGGMAGLSTAWRAAAAGARVAVAERRAIGHRNGSSHGPTRIFRLVYEDAFYTSLAQRARPMWDDLDPSLLRTTGGIDAGSPEHLEQVAAALTACGATFGRGTASAPDWFRDDRDVLTSPDTAVIDAAKALRAMHARATAAGAVVRQNCELVAVDETGWGVRARLAGGDTIHATTLVVAAGAHAPRMLGPVGIVLPVTITREHLWYFEGDLPQVLIDWDALIYALPAHAPKGPVKVAEHMRGAAVDPDGPPLDDPDGLERVRRYVIEHLPTLHPDPVAADTCLYTTTPDHDFVIDRIGRIVVASPCSGHGFKFAPIIGEITAALALGKAPPLDITRFALSRFGS